MRLCAQSQQGLFYPLQLGDEVNFRLTYQGQLKAASQSDTRRAEKHAIRTSFSRQLDELFRLKNRQFLDIDCTDWGEMPNVERGNFFFLSLVREKLNLVCDLDILFLRRDEPGSLIGGGGDLDNRIKVLFDALRVPSEDEVRGYVPLDPKDPMLICLTEDDKLITGFRITSDRLLEPAKTEAEKNNVHLIINVEVKATKLTQMNMAYFSHF
jgi:hypothetical protein